MQIERMCEQWRRWARELERLAEEDGDEELPIADAEIAKQFEIVTGRLGRLQNLVAARLAKDDAAS